MLRSVQGKLILVYLLLILMAMELVSVYLLQKLQQTYEEQTQEDLHQSSELLVGQLANYVTDKGLDTEGIARFVARWPRDVLVLDASGRIIGVNTWRSGNGDLLGKKFVHDDISLALTGRLSEHQGIENGERMVFVSQPVTIDGEVVAAVYLKASLEEAFRRVKDIRSILFGATLVAMGFTAIMGIALARTITEPIREVTRKAAEMADGNFDQVIQVRSGDEIGRLGEMFNRMTRRLKQTLEEIEGEKNKVETILSHMADGLLALGSDGRVIKMNPAAQRMFGTSEEAVIHRFPHEIWQEGQLDELLSQARDEDRYLTREVRIDQRVLLAHITPLHGEHHRATGTVIIFHDITELDRLETMRREFVDNVSHELKTPLTTVKSYVETLLDGAADQSDVRLRFLQVVEGETERMARLVRDLLHLSQLEQGLAHWDIQEYDLPVVVEECIDKLAVQIDQKNLTLRREFAPHLSLGMCDYDKVQQVLLNLLANAVEFTPSGGEIEVSVWSENQMIWVAVRDSGIGIPSEDLPRIFERFYRVDKARSRMLGGTGLGLAIAKQIVELLGGTISIKSDLGRGTEVIFTLPIAHDVEAG